MSNMMLLTKPFNRIILPLVFLFGFLFCTNVAHANVFTDSFAGVFGFVNTRIIGQIKKDFCHNYIISISNGDWKEGEFRTNLGKEFCTSYSVPTDTTNKITETRVQTINENASNPATTSEVSVNNPSPEIYIPGTSANGSKLDVNELFNFTNEARKSNDSTLVDLKYNNTLAEIARIRAKDMFDHQYFAHVSPAGDNVSKEADKNGYSYVTIGENIALGNFDGSQDLLNAWMNSPGHRANILNKTYREIGISAIQGMYKGQSLWISAQIFGKPISGCPSPNAVLKDNVTKYKTSAESIMKSINGIDAELKTLSSTDTETYNTKVAERNTLTGLYNNLASQIKIDVAEYNREVSSFNSCLQ